MAFVRVRHASMYVGGKKAGEMYDNTLTINSGDEKMFADVGFAGMSDGAVTTDLESTHIVPTSAPSVDIDAILLGKQDVDVMVGLIGGKLYTITMRCTQAQYKSDAKTGSLIGTFKFEGGIPTRT